MACGCDTSVCLDVVFNECASVVRLPLNAQESGMYLIASDFNGVQLKESVIVVSGEPIMAPTNIFNGNYQHTVKIYRPNGDLLNNTCYKIKTMASVYANPLPTGVSPAPINYTVPSDGDSITVSGIAGRTVMLFSTDAQSYNQAFFTQVGNTITRTDGGSFSTGQLITLQFA